MLYYFTNNYFHKNELNSNIKIDEQPQILQEGCRKEEKLNSIQGPFLASLSLYKSHLIFNVCQ